MHSEDIASLVGALSKAQGAFPPIVKGKTVTVKMKSGGNYQYSYSPLEDILGACRKALSENGLAIIQTLDEGEGGVLLETMLAHESGEWIKSFKNLGQSNNPQEFGGRLTYYRRYQVSAILGISSEDDDDANSSTGNNTSTKSQKPQPKNGKNPSPSSPDDLIKLINSKVGGYYQGLPHLLNAIRKASGDDGWNWPKEKDVDGWRAAYKLSKDHAEGQKAQPVLNGTDPAPAQDGAYGEES